MKSKKRGFLPILLATLFLIALLTAGFYIYPSVKEIAFGEPVYLPQYSSVWCGICENPTYQTTYNLAGTPWYSMGEFQKKSFICGLQGQYVPKGCTIDIRVTEGGSGEAYAWLCDQGFSTTELEAAAKDWLGIGGSLDVAKCTRYEITTSRILNAKFGQEIFIATENQLQAIAKWEIYCLKTLTGGKYDYASGCSSSILLSKAYNIPAGEMGKLTDAYLKINTENAVNHVITGYVSTLNAADVVKDPKTGSLVYLNQVKIGGSIQACPIITAKGMNFADIENCKFDSVFICMPSLMANCIGGIKLEELPKASGICDEGRIAFLMNEDATKKCQYTCKNGQWIVGDCEELKVYAQPGAVVVNVGNCQADCEDSYTSFNPLRYGCSIKCNFQGTFGSYYWIVLVVIGLGLAYYVMQSQSKTYLKRRRN